LAKVAAGEGRSEKTLEPPDTAGGKDIIHAEQVVWDGRARDSQWDYRQLARRMAVLPSLAVFLLILQIFFGGAWFLGPAVSVACILGEILYLSRMLHVALTYAGPTKVWIQARTRAELLRRESFLRLASVGPYLLECEGPA